VPDFARFNCSRLMDGEGMGRGTKLGQWDKYKRVSSLSIEMGICTTYKTNRSLYYIFYKSVPIVPT